MKMRCHTFVDALVRKVLGGVLPKQKGGVNRQVPDDHLSTQAHPYDLQDHFSILEVVHWPNNLALERTESCLRNESIREEEGGTCQHRRWFDSIALAPGNCESKKGLRKTLYAEACVLVVCRRFCGRRGAGVLLLTFLLNS